MPTFCWYIPAVGAASGFPKADHKGELSFLHLIAPHYLSRLGVLLWRVLFKGVLLPLGVLTYGVLPRRGISRGFLGRKGVR
jgi:hypothetical protein